MDAQSHSPLTGAKNPDHTLAADFYLDPLVVRSELDDLFHNTWQFVCHVSDIAQPGDYFTFEMHGQDYFLVIGTDGCLRGFANVCPHRGHKLLEGYGNKSRITCPYHAWTFGLDGALRGARGISLKAVDFEKLGLIPIAVDTLAGLVFVNTSNDAPPFA